MADKAKKPRRRNEVGLSAWISEEQNALVIDRAESLNIDRSEFTRATLWLGILRPEEVRMLAKVPPETHTRPENETAFTTEAIAAFHKSRQKLNATGHHAWDITDSRPSKVATDPLLLRLVLEEPPPTVAIDPNDPTSSHKGRNHHAND